MGSIFEWFSYTPLSAKFNNFKSIGGGFVRDRGRTLYLMTVDVRLGAPWDVIMREEIRGYGP